MGLLGAAKERIPVGTTWEFLREKSFVVPCTAYYLVKVVGAGGDGGKGGDAYYNSGTGYHYSGCGGGGGSSGCVVSSIVKLTAGMSCAVQVGKAVAINQLNSYFDSILAYGGNDGKDSTGSEVGNGAASAGTGSKAGENGSKGDYTSYAEVAGGKGGAGGGGVTLGSRNNVGHGGAGGKGGAASYSTHKSGKNGSSGATGGVLVKLLSYEEPPHCTVTVSGGGTSTAWVEYNGTKYTSGTITLYEGETVNVAGYSTRNTTIKLNGTTVASGTGASYELTVTADTTIAVSGSFSVTVTITTA